MPSHSEGPGIWLSVWRFLLTHCLYEQAAEVLARLHGCSGLPEPSLLAWAISNNLFDAAHMMLLMRYLSQCMTKHMKLNCACPAKTQISLHIHTVWWPSVVARSEACPLGMQAAPSSINMTWSWKNSTAILPLLLIQEEQLSVTGERMCTKYL